MTLGTVADAGGLSGDENPKNKVKGKGKGKGKTDAEGRPLRCVHFWFAQCKSHPLKDGESCRFGPHVGNPREDEKLRPEFKKMEAIYGTWARNKFKYKTDADEGGTEQTNAPPKLTLPAGCTPNNNTGGTDVTPAGSPRQTF